MNLITQKQDLSIAEEHPFDLHTNPQKTNINLFIAESFKNLQIIQQIYHKSYGLKEQGQMSESSQRAGLKRKMSSRSDSYHRVNNSRKIKTKRTTKQNLPRSQYFYFHHINENAQQGPIQKLLNDYEAFHEMILNNDFSAIEKSVIKLSHYGNKKKPSKSRQGSMKKTDFSNKYHQSYYRSTINGKHEQKKSLSRSAVVPDVELKKSIVMETTQEKLKTSNEPSHSIHSRKHPIPTRQTLPKYTTPIRTIYLNTSQQSPQYLNSLSVNKLSHSTPLRNNQPYLTQNGYRASIYGKKTYQRREIHENQQIHNNKVKLSIVSSQNRWNMTNQFENSQIVPFIKAKPQAQLSKYHSKPITQTQQQNPFSHSSNINFFQTTNSVLHSNRQSRSNSRKGLSLTQSATKIGKSKSQLNCQNPIQRLSHQNIRTQKQLIARKLDSRAMAQSKRVEIRIY